MMRIRIFLAASLGLAGITAAQAAPALPQPALVRGEAIATVDWHPSTRHWDHHFHSHQRSSHHREPTEVERLILWGDADVGDAEWSGYHAYRGRRSGRY